MKTKAAVLREVGADWQIEEIELDAPKAGEVLVKFEASGICHSNEHVRVGDTPLDLPAIPCHEGAGYVQEVGEGVVSLKPGDPVVTVFVPSCGQCPMCATGHQNLCDLNADIGGGKQLSDGTARHHTADGLDITIETRVGSGALHGVLHEAAVVKIPDDIPMNRACLFGCGVPTGWGSAIYAGGGVKPGETAVVVGIGGVGINAVQGAKLAGAEMIIAVDPVPWKLEQAMLFGATHVAASMEEAFSVVQEATWGRMANQVIMTMGLGEGWRMAQASALTAKRGRIIITNIHRGSEVDVTLSMVDLCVMEKQIHGSLYGSCNPRADIPKLISLYRNGLLNLDDVVTRTYPLEQINQGFQDMRDGKNLRGVLQYT